MTNPNAKLAIEYWTAIAKGIDVRCEKWDPFRLPSQGWVNCSPPAFFADHKYRLVYPKRTGINPEVELPLAETKRPEIGTKYWVPGVTEARPCLWQGTPTDEHFLEARVCYATEEAAREVWEASRAHNFQEGE